MNVGLQSWDTEKALDEMKIVKDFDYIQKGKKAEIAYKQQPTQKVE